MALHEFQIADKFDEELRVPGVPALLLQHVWAMANVPQGLDSDLRAQIQSQRIHVYPVSASVRPEN